MSLRIGDSSRLRRSGLSGRGDSCYALPMILRSILLIGILAFALPSEARTWAKKFENRLNLAPTFYFDDIGQETTQSQTAVRYQFEFDLRPSSSLRFHLSPWFYADPVSASVSERALADVNEASLDWRRGDWNLKFGINRHSWGVTDVVNPLDVVSSRRYLDPLNAEKRGTPSVDLIWEREKWRAEAVYVPVRFEAILPGDKSRWLPRDVTYNRSLGGQKIIIADQFKYSIRDKRELDDALKNNFGFRGDYRGGSLDVTTVFFQGAPTAPAIFPVQVDSILINSNVAAATHIALEPRYYLRRTAGLGATWTLDSSIVRFAYANSDRVTQGADLPGWSQIGVLGIEKNFSIGQTTLNALLQYSYGAHETSVDNTLTSIDRIFDRALMLGLNLTTSSDWTFGLAGLYDSANSGGFAQAKIERKLRDGLTSSLTGDWIDGASGTPLGTYRRNKRATVSLTAFF